MTNAGRGAVPLGATVPSEYKETFELRVYPVTVTRAEGGVVNTGRNYGVGFVGIPFEVG